MSFVAYACSSQSVQCRLWNSTCITTLATIIRLIVTFWGLDGMKRHTQIPISAHKKNRKQHQQQLQFIFILFDIFLFHFPFWSKPTVYKSEWISIGVASVLKENCCYKSHNAALFFLPSIPFNLFISWTNYVELFPQNKTTATFDDGFERGSVLISFMQTHNLTPENVAIEVKCCALTESLVCIDWMYTCNARNTLFTRDVSKLSLKNWCVWFGKKQQPMH